MPRKRTRFPNFCSLGKGRNVTRLVNDDCFRQRSIFRPLRILQFTAIFLLFVFVVYMIAIDPSPMSVLACLLLITLTSMYVFVLGLELINEFGNREQRESPMFIFSLLGVIFFGTAGVLLTVYPYSKNNFWAILASLVLSLLITLLLLIDVLIVLALWKRKCTTCRKCCMSLNENQAEVLFQRSSKIYSGAKIATRDLTTSVSSLRVPTGIESTAIPDHSYRKINVPRRREYIDCPTNVPSMSAFEYAQVQTDPKAVRVIDCQTYKKDVKEALVQTASKCELCQQRMQPYPPTQKQPSVPHSVCSPQCTICPTFVQLIRGSIGPCCPNCKCSTGIVQVPQQQRGLQQETHPQRVTEENLQLIPVIEKSPRQETVTKVTLASFCVTPKRMQSACQTTDSFAGKPTQSSKLKTAESQKGTQNPMNDDSGCMAVQEVSDVRIATTTGDGTIKPNADETKRTTQENALIRSLEEGTPSTMKDIKNVQGRKETPMLKLYANPQADAADDPENNRTRPRTHAFQKKNKIDPQTEMQLIRPKRGTAVIDTICSNTLSAKVSRHDDQQSFTNMDASRYYGAHKDKRRTYYCENCGSTNLVKLKDHKILKCAKCGYTVHQTTSSLKKKLESTQKKGEHGERINGK